MLRVCLVEDEESIGGLIKLNLELEGYQVNSFTNGMEAYNHLMGHIDYDILMLDVMLPGMNGIELCRKVRGFSDVPILFLSAKGTTSDRVEGLKAGGNDYLPKPFDLEELLLRVRSLCSLKTGAEEPLLSIGNWNINFKSYDAEHALSKEIIHLSRKEIELLKLFQQHEGQVIPRSEILDHVWGKDQFPTTRTIDNFIMQLRKHFEENPKEPKHFHSIRGVGYRFTN